MTEKLDGTSCTYALKRLKRNKFEFYVCSRNVSPKNAVLGREYTDGFRKEPGDRRNGVAGVTSLDLRSIENQAADPAWTNRDEKSEFRFPLPFTKRK